MNSLDPYLELFSSLSWEIGKDNIIFKNTGLVLDKDPRYQQFLIPITDSIKLYFFDIDEEILVNCPSGLTGFEILDAINNFYKFYTPRDNLKHFGGLLKYKDGYCVPLSN